MAKIARTDCDGLPIACHLGGGEASDCCNFETLIDIGPDITPRAALAETSLRRASRAAAQPNAIGDQASVPPLDEDYVWWLRCQVRCGGFGRAAERDAAIIVVRCWCAADAL